MINKKLIEKIVDIKNQINKVLILLLIFLFPLNQQYHIRPFSSVDGFIIDYLIVKVSIPEIIVFSLFLINLNEIYKIFLQKRFLFLIILFLLVIQSILRSNYFLLAFYENLLLFAIFSLGCLFYQNLEIIKPKLLIKSLKIWILFLTLIACLQFLTQSSIFNNYSLTGEFPYSEDYYHIKQKSIFFNDLIPPYTIFSHSNIYGGYLVFLLFLLLFLENGNYLFLGLVLINLIIVGSVACLLAFFILLVSSKIDSKQLRILLLTLTALSLVVFFLNSFKYKEFSNDYSIYRRLYMFDLSSNYFIDHPLEFLFGSGYFNYFQKIKLDLYNYEIVRFFQPPHYAPVLIIWQYGFVFLILILIVILRNFKNFNQNFLRFLLIILVLGSFDHYILTNHQHRILFVIVIPYSLKNKNRV